MATEKITKKRMSPKVRVDITEARIASSARRNSSHCMIAEAMRDVLPATCKGIAVDLYSAAFTDHEKNLRFSYELPRNAQLALIQFDRGEVPEPFSFMLQRARKITRRRPDGTKASLTREERLHAKKQVKQAVAQNIDADDSGPERLAEDKKILEALNNPGMPLQGPRVISEHGPKGIETTVGGRPTPLSNFAKRRRFGLRQLAE